MTTPEKTVLTPVDPVIPTSGQHHSYVTEWLQTHLHLIPIVHELATDAAKARKVIPLVEEFLPKLEAAAGTLAPAEAVKLAPILEEAATILSVIASL